MFIISLYKCTFFERKAPPHSSNTIDNISLATKGASATLSNIPQYFLKLIFIHIANCKMGNIKS